MYDLPYFKENDQRTVRDFIRAHPFAMLASKLPAERQRRDNPKCGETSPVRSRFEHNWKVYSEAKEDHADLQESFGHRLANGDERILQTQGQDRTEGEGDRRRGPWCQAKSGGPNAESLSDRQGQSPARRHFGARAYYRHMRGEL
jgi:hypothetical protein